MNPAAAVHESKCEDSCDGKFRNMWDERVTQNLRTSMKTDSKAVVSSAGRRALLNIAAGRNSWHGLKGRAAMGGHKSTLMALRRAGLVTLGSQLTDAGRKAIAAAKKGK